MSAPDALQELCLACGLCCDGSLFDAVVLSDREAQAPEWSRHITGRGARGIRVGHPCPHLEDRRCRIYAERPATCRGYVCEVYRDLANGMLSATDAHAEIRSFQHLVAEIESALRDRATATPEETAGNAHGRSRSFSERLTRAAAAALDGDEQAGALVDAAIAFRNARARFVTAARRPEEGAIDRP